MADFSAGLFLVASISLTGPLVLAAMGGLLSERSGIMNIALEGKMLTAACITALVAEKTGSPWLSLGAGILAGILVSMLHLVLTQTYRFDHIVSGMAINALALGGTNVLRERFTALEGTGQVATLPMGLYQWLALASVALLAWALVRTRPGLHLLATGEDPSKARQMGLHTDRVRFWALVGTGVLCGVAGAMIMSNAGGFTDGMTAGRGYIALAALILGGWRPMPAMLACAVFGSFEALQLQLQGSTLLGADLPREFWNALPYLVTLLALGGLLGRSRSPAGLGKA